MSLRQLRGGLLAQRATPAGDTLALLRPTLPAAEVAEHRHDEAHWVLVLRGRYAHGARGAGDAGLLLISNPPRTEHADCFVAGEHLPAARFVCLQLDAATWWRWQQQADLPARPEAGHGAAAAQRWLTALHAGDEPLGALELDELLAVTWPNAPKEAASDWLDRARHLLREACLDDDAAPAPSLTALAARLRVHPVSLARGFQRRWGLSPSRYAQGLRLDRACALLRQSPRRSVAEVAQVCGFHDQAHFTRQFRAAYGTPPQRWRA